MQREVIKWVQSLDLTNAVQNPKRDLATGHAAAEIVCRYTGTKYIELQRLPSGASSATKRDVWLQVYTALQKLRCEAVTPQLIDAVLRREPNAALTVLECLYEHFTGHTLPMRGLDAVGTTRNAYVQPSNAASTAKLLAVANGTVTTTRSGTSAAALYDPLEAGATGSADAAAAGKNQKKTRYPADTTTITATTGGNAATSGAAENGVGMDGAGSGAPEHATRTLQHRLALIDNDELAGGANALQAYPRYARPTASTLVHAATANRKDVVLDRPKYTADETRQREQNARIAQQHAAVQRLQEESAAAAAGEEALASSLSWPAPGNYATGRGGVSAGELPLTSVYRGRFYKEPDFTHTAGGGGGAAKNKAGGLPAIGATRPTATTATAPWTSNGADDDAEERGSGGNTTRPASSREKTGRTGSGGNTRSVHKLRVQVHSTALQNALALRSGDGQLRERAAALSREIFAKHNFQLRPALSEILCDVLGAHKQLEHLLDCSSDDGSGEALENVLGHLLAHRHAFPLSSIKACWETLSQHVEGIAATVQQTPDEYSYLMECFAFAFAREAAQVPTLQMANSPTTLITVTDGYGFSGCGGDGGATSASVAEVDTSAETVAPPLSDKDGSENPLSASSSSSQQSSMEKNATAATRRASEMVTAATVSSERAVPRRLSASRQSRQRQQQQLPLIANARQQVDLVSLFQLLRSVARRLEGPTASYVLRRYTLRAAKPFLLRHGTAAVREAVAALLSASFASMALPTPEVEAAFVSCLCDDVAAVVLVSSAASVTAPLHSNAAANTEAPLAAQKDDSSAEALPSFSPLQLHDSSEAMQRQRAFWHVFYHAMADFTAPASPTDGPLARCAHAAAVSCLDSSDVVVRAIGVALVELCCERWWPLTSKSEGTDNEQAKEETGESSVGRVTRFALRQLVARVLGDAKAPSCIVDGEAAAPSDSKAWWNVRLPETWELRIAVLHLCTTLLTITRSSSGGGDAEDEASDDVDVSRIADAAAALCLSTFAATGTDAASPVNYPSSSDAWQLQLALTAASTALSRKHAPAMTAQWCTLLSGDGGPMSSPGRSVVPSDGVDVHLLLSPLQSLSGGRSFWLPPRLSSPTTAAAAAAAFPQGIDNPHSAGRSFKNTTEGKNGMGGGVAGTRSQRTTAPSVLGDTAASLPSLADHGDAVQLVCGRVRSAYAELPLFQVCSTLPVLDAVLANAAATPLLQLQVLTATLAAAAPTRGNDEGFWMSVTLRIWPLLQPVTAAQDSAYAHLPSILHARDVEEREIAAMAVLVVALFLRAAEEDAVAADVASAEGDWRVLCASAMQWAAAAVDEAAEAK